LSSGNAVGVSARGRRHRLCATKSTAVHSFFVAGLIRSKLLTRECGVLADPGLENAGRATPGCVANVS
jgi:hypothetical protein